MWTCFGTQHFILCREVVLFQSLFCTDFMVHLVCPLFRGLSSFGVSFIGGFTVHKPDNTAMYIIIITLLSFRFILWKSQAVVRLLLLDVWM